LVFGIGFLIRPLGGLFFGRIGDLAGRKKSFILSIALMTIPTFALGLLPTYDQVGYWAPLFLIMVRLLQAFPAAGETPGAACFLFESADPKNRRFMCSWTAVGNQIGVIISMLECYLLEQVLSREQLITWGWRLSFIIGGLMGIFSFYLRKKLHETPLFQDLKIQHHIPAQSIFAVLNQYKSKIGLGIGFFALDASAFYLISVLFPVFFEEILGSNYSKNLIIGMAIITLCTLPMPFFGRLGDHWNNKHMLIGSTVGVLLVAIPLYISIVKLSLIGMVIFSSIFILFIACITAILPYVVSDLFPTSVRFTCSGMSFNIADTIIGGFSPALALFLYVSTGHQSSFMWIIVICAIWSLISYLKIKDVRKGSPGILEEKN
jgi:MHS family proline/betaine transporter-like MFS transporter